MASDLSLVFITPWLWGQEKRNRIGLEDETFIAFYCFRDNHE
jgi:hypothetical protein